MNIHTIKRYHAKQRRNRAGIFSLIFHIVLVIGVAIWLLKPPIPQEEDSFLVEFVPPTQQSPIPKKRVQAVPRNKAAASPRNAVPQSQFPRISPIVPHQVQPKREAPVDTTMADLTPSPEAILNVDSPTIKRGSDDISDTRTGPEFGSPDRGSGAGLGNVTSSGGVGQDAFDGEPSDIVDKGGDKNGGGTGGTGDELGSHIDEEGGVVRGHISLIRLKHNISDWWQDPTAIPSLLKWLREHRPTITADMDYKGGALPLTDNSIMDAPLLIMTGHDQAMSVSYKRLADRNAQASGFSPQERAALRKYILDYNGMLFFDYCGNGGNEKSFARLVETELRTVFPEYPLTTLDIQHEVFQCYFKLDRVPVGGSTFWGTNYKGGSKKFLNIKGISVQGRLGKQRLAVVFCPLDYLCSMETEAVDSRAPLASRRSEDVYRFMTNMFVYQMRQREHNK